jgi:L-asparagine transporter-like permease
MLAVMFGIGRMMRSLSDEGLAPHWLKDKTDVPYRGILFSGLTMLFALWFGMLFPSVYLFLISSGGFAILFSYVVIMLTHIRFRRAHGCPPDGHCQMRGYPFTSLFTLFALLLAIVSMPFVAGQTSGLIAGIVIVLFYTLSYQFVRVFQQYKLKLLQSIYRKRQLQFEASEELSRWKREQEETDGGD